MLMHFAGWCGVESLVFVAGRSGTKPVLHQMRLKPGLAGKLGKEESA
jgi:hypothetical protein